jgi:hypothetical protein
MLNLQLREPSAGEIALTEPILHAEHLEPAEFGETLVAADEGEFEIVLGKRQLAGVLFVAIVILVVFSALSYLAGKAASPKKAMAWPPSTPAPALQSTIGQTAIAPATIIQATIVKADDPPPPVAKPKPEAKSADHSAADPLLVTAANLASTTVRPLFGDPAIGAVYFQMGAVEKGVAVIFVEGLRSRGFEAFVAPGRSENIYRVLIGPLRDHDSYLRAKNALDTIGLNTFFARKYLPESAQPKVSSATAKSQAPEPTEASGPEGSLPLGTNLGTLVDGAGLPVHVVH